MATITELECKKCGYMWTPRTPDPKVCPRCKRHDWNDSIWGVKNVGRPRSADNKKGG